MTRELHVPLLLWVCAAFVVHLAGGWGVRGVTLIEEKKAAERADIRAMVWDVRRELGVVELEVEGGVEETREQPLAEEDESLLAFAMRLMTAEQDPDAVENDAVPLDPLKAFWASLVQQLSEEAEQEKAEKEPEPQPPPEEQAKIAPPPPEEQEKPEEAKPETPLKVQIFKDKRIAIDQVTKDKNQQNPDAPRLAEHANRVDEETQARIRSSDQKAENPSAGTNNRGPNDQEGNSDKERFGQAEDRPGDPETAPGEASTTNRDTEHSKPSQPDAKSPKSGGVGEPSTAPGAQGRSGERPSANVPGLPGGAGPASPDVHSHESGDWLPNPSRPGGSGSTGQAGKPSLVSPGALPFRLPGFAVGLPGDPGGAPNLTFDGLEKAVGDEQLRKERAAVGQAIRAQHRGRFDTTKFERFLPDIENYDPSVKLGNQTALNAAASPFAKYLHDIHNRIHPIFADEFLHSLESLPIGHPLRSNELVAHVEIILAKENGKVVRMGVTKNSGSTIFDAAALDSVDRAGQNGFGKAPDAIVSKDGLVYLHWEFHRNLVDACSTRNAHPFVVQNPKPVKPNIPPRKKKKKSGGKPSDESAQPSGPLVPLRKK